MSIALIVDWAVDNWAMLAASFPVLAAALAWVAHRIGKLGPIIMELYHVLKDKEASDKEIATIVWMFAAVLVGLFSKPSYKVLNYAPDHQIALLKAKQFIPASYRPEVKAVT
ncbi:MAG: hypothetical protein KOO63_05475 [Bacteroidales bacterium]|nr:hypothetical protein [Candidatus Latescibacterota bacterium]